MHLLPEAVWDEMIAVTLKGLYFCCKQALPHMIAAHNGFVINTSSTDALIRWNSLDAGRLIQPEFL